MGHRNKRSKDNCQVSAAGETEVELRETERSKGRTSSEEDLSVGMPLIRRSTDGWPTGQSPRGARPIKSNLFPFDCTCSQFRIIPKGLGISGQRRLAAYSISSIASLDTLGLVVTGRTLHAVGNQGKTGSVNTSGGIAKLPPAQRAIKSLDCTGSLFRYPFSARP